MLRSASVCGVGGFPRYPFRSHQMPVRLTFLGAAGTVTGSRYLLEANGRRILVDCGLFQGAKAIRQRNWDEPGFEAGSLDAIVLTHAHVDHCAYLPVVV